jgi:hypothetical protein
MSPDQLLAEWRATYQEIFPQNNAEAMMYHDSTLALGVLLTRRMDQLAKTRVIEPAYPVDYEHQPTVRPKGKRRPTDGD